jgi:hypothetical protein
MSARDLARRYVKLSNESRIDAALAMFADDAHYESSQAGTHVGRDAIAAMMRGFFTRFPSPHWEVARYDTVDDLTAEFAFTMTAATSTGETIIRRGIERISFDLDGRIRSVVVDVRA